MSDFKSRRYILEALAALPSKIQNKNLVGKLKKFSEIAVRSRDSLADSINSSARFKLVFPDVQLSGVTEKVATARKRAKSCLRDLSQNIEAVEKNSFETRLIEMQEQANLSKRPIPEAWQKRLDEVTRPYETLAIIVSDQKLPGGEALVKSLGGLKYAQTTFPSTSIAAEEVKRQIAALPAIISTLGLTGKVGPFLIAAARGSASPRELEDQEIRKFLDTYKLWDSLRVRFGATE